MLNKDVCIKCVNQLSVKHKKWDEEDENRWKIGVLWCVKSYNVLVDENPPENCKYTVEHIVSDLGEEITFEEACKLSLEIASDIDKEYEKANEKEAKEWLGEDE